MCTINLKEPFISWKTLAESTTWQSVNKGHLLNLHKENDFNRVGLFCNMVSQWRCSQRSAGEPPETVEEVGELTSSPLANGPWATAWPSGVPELGGSLADGKKQSETEVCRGHGKGSVLVLFLAELPPQPPP